MKHNKGMNKGFTLVEVIIVVGVIGIMAAIAVPAIMSWMPNIRQKAAARELFADLQRAKMEAIKRNAPAVVVITPAASCAVTGGSYSMFIDDGAGLGVAGNKTLDGGEQNFVQQAMPQEVSLCFESGPAVQTVGFRPTGLPLNAVNPTIKLISTKGRSSQVTLTTAGGIRIE